MRAHCGIQYSARKVKVANCEADKYLNTTDTVVINTSGNVQDGTEHTYLTRGVLKKKTKHIHTKTHTIPEKKNP